MTDVINFYVDDSGARHPGRPENQSWNKHCHWFALGGVLIHDSDEDNARTQIGAFRMGWPQLADTALHSYEIRNKREGFHWLAKLSNGDANRFYSELEALLVGLAILGVACVIDGPGYNARYHEKYGDKRWMMCKTAFVIAVERAAKHAIKSQCRLRVLIERSAKAAEDDLRRYFNALKIEGHPFARDRAGAYAPLSQEDYCQVLYEFATKAKTSPLMQIADLMLWPICKGGYDAAYKPYSHLEGSGKLLDCRYPGQEDGLGTKYSCFDLWRAEH